MVIPHRQLSPEALRGIIEDFVTREGTDYGDIEISLDMKVEQVRRKLERGECMILFDLEHETLNIAPANQLAVDI